MITLRVGTANDVALIARLHANSWKTHYRGIMSDEYLDSNIEAERLAVWTERFASLNPKQYVVIMEMDGQPCGFACTFAEKDEKYGNLLDNLHIVTYLQGKGLGMQLIQATAKWSHDNYPNLPFYLWVYEQNQSALQFYKNLGGQQYETKIETNTDGSQASIIRIVWQDVKALVEFSRN